MAQVTRIIDTFEALEDKTTEYAKLLTFLESEHGRNNCYSMIEREEEDGVVTGLVGRINDNIIRVLKGKRRTFEKRRQQRYFLGDDFTLEAAQDKFVECVYDKEINDETREELESNLTAWCAHNHLLKFLPNSSVTVTNYSTNSASIEIRNRGSVISTATASSVPAAKHTAICKLLNSEPYRSIFVRSPGISYAQVSKYTKDDLSEQYKKMMVLVRLNTNNRDNSLTRDFNEDTDTNELSLCFSAEGDTADNAALAGINRMRTLRLENDNRKTFRNNQKRNANETNPMTPLEKMAKIDNPIGQLMHLAQTNGSSNPEFSFVKQDGGDWTCFLQCGPEKFSYSSGNQKEAKNKVAAIAVDAFTTTA